MSPDASAAARNWSGPSSPRCGCSQRSSPSSPTVCAAREVHDRLVVQQELVLGERAVQRGLGLERGGGRGPQLLVEHLVAVPARVPWPGRRRCRRSGRARRRCECSSATAIPMLAVTNTSRPCSSNGVPSVSAMRWASCSASTGDSMSVQTTTNSSPPVRAARSEARSTPCEPLRERDEQVVAGRVAERVVDELEPVEVEEQDRDVGVRARRRAAAPGRASRAGACGSGRPVSGSCAASWASRSSSCLRSVTSNITPSSQSGVAVVVVGGLALLDDPADAAVAVPDRVLDHERAAGARARPRAPGRCARGGRAGSARRRARRRARNSSAVYPVSASTASLTNSSAYGGVASQRYTAPGMFLHERAEPGLALAQLALGPQPLPDVAEADDDAADGRVVEQVARLDLDRDPARRRCRAAASRTGPRGARRRGARRSASSGDGVVVGVDEVHRVHPGDGRRA